MLYIPKAATIRRVARFTQMAALPPSYAIPAHTHLVYFVHDLNDPAVARRLAMLRPHLAAAVIIGFRRAEAAPAQLAGWKVVDLGRTADGRLGRRALSVLHRLVTISSLAPHMRGATLIIARQLEMLALATAARRGYARHAALVYECLDIHRMMLKSRMMRRVEAGLLRQVDRVIVSAPAFADAYLRPVHGAALPPVSLIENKMLRGELREPGVVIRPAGPPWRIGWYGVLRCRRSLLLLAELTRAFPGQIIVELRGRPALTAIPDFHELIAEAPHMRFLGAYDRSTDLAGMYNAVHFSWAVDFYEAGQNSAWLLPNRLYEGGAHGAVPLADATVATGQWLARHDAGILLHEPLAASLTQFFNQLDATGYAAASHAIAAVAPACWVDDGMDAQQFIAALGSRHRG